jgi:hypothetical protein
MTRPYPAPPHVVAGFVLTGTTEQAAVDAVTGAAVAAGAVAARGKVPRTPDREPLLVEVIFGSSPQAALGVELTISGDLLGLPPGIELDGEQRAIERKMERFVRAAFVAACERLAPLYAGVDLEWRIPDPQGLALDGARLPGDLYWSRALDEADPALSRDLAGIFARAGQSLGEGTLIGAGGLLEPSLASSPPSLASRAAAAARLAPAVERALAAADR